MSGVQAGADFGALHAGAAQIGLAGEAFGQGAGQVGGLPGAPAPDPRAGAILDQVIEAIAGALGKAAAELGDLSAGLSATVASYEQAEQALACWHVPGGTT